MQRRDDSPFAIDIVGRGQGRSLGRAAKREDASITIGHAIGEIGTAGRDEGVLEPARGLGNVRGEPLSDGIDGESANRGRLV